MKNQNIAKILKQKRKENNLTVKEVASMLEKKSLTVSEKTIYGWENGQSQPDADTLLLLCEIYKINDILGSFGYTKTESIALTSFEKKLVINLRKHPEMLDAIKKLLDL